MKFQIDELVEHPDSDLVLRTLEQCFREVSLRTVRMGDQLVVYGLGPSYRTMNHNDKTVVLATHQPTGTVVHTEANFLASALMGDVSQDDVVRSKIRRVFETLKAELGSNATLQQKASKVLPPVEPVVAAPADSVVSDIAKDSPSTPVEAEPVSPLPVKEVQELSTQPVEQQPEQQPEQQREPKKDDSVPTPTRLPEVVFSAVEREDAPVKKRRSVALVLLPVLLLLLAAGGYFLQRRGLLQNFFASKPEVQTVSPAVESKVAAPVAAAPSPEPSAAPAAMPRDIKAWVAAWAAAMNTRDVQAQLAFYATPLDRYFLTPDVSREQLLKNKQEEIDNRQGLWTFKAEDVDVQKETPTTAVVGLVKHIIVELPSSTIKQQHIKTQLKLKLVDGSWKITSERAIY